MAALSAMEVDGGIVLRAGSARQEGLALYHSIRAHYFGETRIFLTPKMTDVCHNTQHVNMRVVSQPDWGGARRSGGTGGRQME